METENLSPIFFVETNLIGVYFYFDNKHEPGAEIFTSLLAKMEAQYGEFT